MNALYQCLNEPTQKYENVIERYLQKLLQKPSNVHFTNHYIYRMTIYQKQFPGISEELKNIEQIVLGLQKFNCILCVDMDSFEMLFLDTDDIKSDSDSKSESESESESESDFEREKKNRMRPKKKAFEKVFSFMQSRRKPNYSIYVTEKISYPFRNYFYKHKFNLYQNSYGYNSFMVCLYSCQFKDVHTNYLLELRWKKRRAALLVASRILHGNFFHVLKWIACFL